MSIKNILAVLAASSLLSLLALSPVYAESIPAEEAQQLSNTPAPDVDAGASKGSDATIVTQEKAQLDNSTSPDVPERAEKGGESIPQLEKKDLE
jgi:hypothetical protein